jgi:hypothetical protein
MLADAMMPEAYEHGGKLAGLATVWIRDCGGIASAGVTGGFAPGASAGVAGYTGRTSARAGAPSPRRS